MGIFKNIVFLIEKYGNLFLIGTGYTLLLSLITVFFGTILGSVLAMLKNNKFLPVKFNCFKFKFAFWDQIWLVNFKKFKISNRKLYLLSLKKANKTRPLMSDKEDIKHFLLQLHLVSRNFQRFL